MVTLLVTLDDAVAAEGTGPCVCARKALNARQFSALPAEALARVAEHVAIAVFGSVDDTVSTVLAGTLDERDAAYRMV